MVKESKNFSKLEIPYPLDIEAGSTSIDFIFKDEKSNLFIITYF